MDRSKKNILVIDDSEDARIIVRTALERRDYIVHEASSVAEGIEKSHRIWPDLIILDLQMPEESGFDFLKKRSRDQRLKPIPVIITSRVNERAPVNLALFLGTTDYIIKPFDTKLLVKKVKKRLNEKNFFQFTFKESEQPAVNMKTAGTITHVHNAGMRLKSTVRLKENSQVSIISPMIDLLNLNHCILKTSAFPAFYDGEKLFESQILFTGLDTDQLRTISGRIEKYVK